MPLATSINMVVQDEAGKDSSTGIYVPTATSLANALYTAQALALLVDATITGKITRLSVTYAATLPAGLRASPLAGSSVAEGAFFQYSTPAGFRTGFRLPTFDESAFNSARHVNLADADVLALNNGMVGGISLVPVGGTGAVNPCNISEDDIASLVFAKEAGKFVRR